MISLDVLLLSANYIEQTEGVVITFENGKMAKQKHRQYLEIHNILSDGLDEHKLIRKILNEEIDDVLSVLPTDALTERKYIDDVSKTIITHVNDIVDQAYTTFNENYNGDRGSFARKYIKHPLFHLMTAMFHLNTEEHMRELYTNTVIFKCRRLKLARTYLKDLGVDRTQHLNTK